MSTSNSPLSPTSQAQDKMQSSEQDEENQEMPDFNPEDDEVEEEEQEEQEDPSAKEPRPPRETRKDKDLNTFLNSMDKYAPIIPDAVTDYYLSLAGFECSDQRVKRLLALCTQKFISDLATDAYQFSKIRSSSSASAAQIPQMGARAGRPGKDKGRSVLTLEDLSAALGDGGVNIKRPEFYR